MVKRLVLCAAMVCAMSAMATEGVAEMAVELFGKEPAKKSVEKGALFIDGLFIKAPYSVSREGNVILVNGRIASRFAVGGAADEKAEADARAAQSDPAADGTGAVSDEDGATIGSNDTAPSAIDAKVAKKKGKGSIEDRLNAKKRAKNLKEKSSAGTFNQEATSGDPTALFEEADYTFTPPSKPEPKAVPYIRPGAKKSMGEQFAAAKAKEAEAQAKNKAAAAEGTVEDEQIAVENFDNLTEEEIAKLTKMVTAFRSLVEKSLEQDRLVFLSSTNSGAKAEKKPIMQRFVVTLKKLCEAPDDSRLIRQWGKTLPEGYLSRIYNNREANTAEMKELVQRVAADVKAERAKAGSRKK